MNTVSFETAKALRDAGFPQPEPAPGQFWWHKHPSTAKTLDFVQAIEVISGVKSFYTLWLASEDTGGNFYPCVGHNLIFAPQAHDILSALMDYEKLSLATEGISEFLEIIILPEELAKKWMEFNSKPA